MEIDLTGLEGKWQDATLDVHVCAACGRAVGDVEEDIEEAFSMPEEPVIVTRDHPTEPGRRQELAFHMECARRRKA